MFINIHNNCKTLQFSYSKFEFKNSKNHFLKMQLYVDVEDTLKMHGYNVMTKIGAGATGRCYRVFSPKYNQTFVCKTVGHKATFVQELNALMRLDHPHVIKVYDYFVHDNICFMILEDCINGNISEFMKKRTIKENQITKWCYEVIDALSYIHQQGIVHLDIKPSNILIDQYERVKLADFGVAQPSDLRCENYVGTTYFMAPEVLSKEPFDPYAADVWSLGVTLYYMIFKQLPFKNEGQWEIFLEIGFRDFPSQISDELHKILTSCIQKYPSNRATTAQLKETLYPKKKTVDEKMKKQNLLLLNLGKSKNPLCASMLNFQSSLRPKLVASVSQHRFSLQPHEVSNLPPLTSH